MFCFESFSLAEKYHKTTLNSHSASKRKVEYGVTEGLINTLDNILFREIHDIRSA
jgi:hypothetical protein